MFGVFHEAGSELLRCRAAAGSGPRLALACRGRGHLLAALPVVKEAPVSPIVASPRPYLV